MERQAGRFDPRTERFETFALPRPHANVRQMMGRPGEVWLSESAPIIGALQVWRSDCRKQVTPKQP